MSMQQEKASEFKKILTALSRFLLLGFVRSDKGGYK